MIGRKKEIEELQRLYDDGRAELVAIYGRRRIGKTFLVDETFAGRITFRHAGLSPVGEEPKGLLSKQLQNFYHSLLLSGMGETEKPSSWMDAFFLLEKYLQERDDDSRQLIFLDELPWMDTPRSGFMSAFESFWNNWACHRKNVMVIVCGSASSWIQDKLINNHGGLYNRVTYEIKLLPFTLRECEDFYKERRVQFSRYDIAQSYMILGGVPYYLGYMDGQLSLPQNVDHLFFTKSARLSDEYDRLFLSLFTSPDLVKSIIELLYKRNSGYTRKEIVEKLGISDNGRLTQNLKALLASDFVVRYVPFGEGKRNERYKLVDPFCLFYLHFVAGKKKESHYWENHQTTQPVVVWRGIAFENVCLHHVDQIKKALGVVGVASENSVWTGMNEEGEGMQIDLVINRKDNVINLCEMKYYGGDFTVDKTYYKELLKRQTYLSGQVSPRTSVRNTLVTTFGLTRNEYGTAFSNVVTLDDLFCEI
ncbi:AAA family ATPase [Dialister sp.]|uniref:AAA family ATPase n=1 Tax=Dialister sp. TaxID=1955814 RepID=UPI002E80F210|nr:ATP-binding protein [Dialister sp.]MEE3452929.1 ATP-binding protein [Dialister sp.]